MISGECCLMVVYKHTTMLAPHFNAMPWLHGSIVPQKLSCTFGCCHVFPPISWRGWWFLRLRCLLTLLRRELIGVTRYDCMQRGYRMEGYRTVFTNAADRNCAGHRPNQSPQIPQSCYSEIFGIFGSIRRYTFRADAEIFGNTQKQSCTNGNLE
jgi:hypothetical protein